MLLWEQISELSTRTLDFSRHYAALAHQTQRSGPVLGSLPTLNEVEDILHLQRRNQDALIRIRTAVVNQEQALAEQMAQRKAFKPGEDDHMAMYQEEFKGAGGFAGADSKKRRGVSFLDFSLSFLSIPSLPVYPHSTLHPTPWLTPANRHVSIALDPPNITRLWMANQTSSAFLQKAAPPGRCHSCNRAETPEWRRGPDGARTLCNACGLHYAKLTRKMGANKAATLGSNLKPKTVLDSASPTSH